TNTMLLAALVLTGCGVNAQSSREQSAATAATAQTRPLVIFLRAEPGSVAWRGFKQSSANIRTPQRVFNAQPAVRDVRGQPQPELLSSLPALNTESWQVFADGTMQTIYTLRPNLVWHDGEPFTADDFVFSWRVYSSPELGQSGQPPFSALSEVSALDREHFMIRWKVLYPDAETLSLYARELPPLPKHIATT